MTAPRQRSEEGLFRRLKFERFLFNLSQTFLGLTEKEIDAYMASGLAHVGEFFDLDRVTLMELTRDRSASPMRMRLAVNSSATRWRR